MEDMIEEFDSLRQLVKETSNTTVFWGQLESQCRFTGKNFG
jgi:hypothetical protein